MWKISTLLFIVFACFITSKSVAQRYFKTEHGKQIIFHASVTKFIAKSSRPLSEGFPHRFANITIDSAESLGKNGLLLLHLRPNPAISNMQVHIAGRRSRQFEYITPVLLTEKGAEIGSLTDRIMLKLKNSTGVAQLNSLVQASGMAIVKKYDFDQNVYFIKLPPDSINYALEISDRLLQTGLFQYVEPDYLLFIKKATNDPFFNNQWSLNNTGQNGWLPGADIKAVSAWNVTTGCSSVHVAVVDNGVQLTHPDLQANLLPGFDATGGTTAGGPDPGLAHGTACAGIIGAVANNSIGIAGIAYNCRIIPVKSEIATSNQLDVTTSEYLAAGIDWSWQNGADVISCSWGTQVGTAGIEQAITNAVTNGRNGLGTVVCVATGNDNASFVSFPASDPDVIAVGASSPCDQRQSPSSCDGDNWGANYGTGLDVVAPGENIFTTDLQGAVGYTTSDYYTTFSGTSAAAPHVAATVALIFSANPNLTGLQARHALESTADKVGWYSYATTAGHPNGAWNIEMGYGRINAYNAVLAAIGMNLTGPSVLCINTNGTYSIANAPANLAVTWTVGPGLQIVSGQNTPSIQVNALSSTSINTVQASFAAACGASVVLSQNVVVNPAPIIVGGYYTSNGSQVPLTAPEVNNVCLVTRLTNTSTSMTIIDYPTSVIWQPDVISTGLLWSQSGNDLNLTFRTVGQTGAFIISATNACGTQNVEYTFRSVSCSAAAAKLVPDYTLQLSPNPATNTIRITAARNLASDARTSGISPAIQRVSIYDITGRLIKKFEYRDMSQQVEVNVNDIHSGVYIVDIFNGVNSSQKKVIIQH